MIASACNQGSKSECALPFARFCHGLSARDALHLAVMELHRIEAILSFDAGFDGLPGITRLA